MTCFPRWLAAAAAAAAVVLVVAPGLAQAAPAPTPAPIPVPAPVPVPVPVPVGQNQYFAGEVNGNLGASVLSVSGCPSPTAGVIGRGTVLPGQTVKVTHFLVPPPGVGGNIVGYTGRAHKISADLQVSLVEPPLIYRVHVADLTTYETTAFIPFLLSVPCNATVTAVFTPVNGGARARVSDVALTLGHPTIVPSQAQVMAPQSITLQGRGFVPHLSYSIQECSQTVWLAGQDPCLAANSVTVTTDAQGGFTSPFVVTACSPAATSLVSPCYLGAPTPTGVDELYLAGATRVLVG